MKADKDSIKHSLIINVIDEMTRLKDKFKVYDTQFFETYIPISDRVKEFITLKQEILLEIDKLSIDKKSLLENLVKVLNSIDDNTILKNHAMSYLFSRYINPDGDIKYLMLVDVTEASYAQKKAKNIFWNEKVQFNCAFKANVMVYCKTDGRPVMSREYLIYSDFKGRRAMGVKTENHEFENLSVKNSRTPRIMRRSEY